MDKKSKIIAFCGIDGCGKSTQLKLVHEALQADYKVHDSRLEYFPLNKMGTSKIVDDLLKVRSGLEIISHYSRLQIHEAREYDFILCDRHLLCYLAYAMAYDVNKIDLIQRLLSFIRNPDLTLYFDMDVDESLRRINSRGKAIDKSENRTTLIKSQAGYEYLIRKMDNVARIDANGPIENTSEQVNKVLSKQLKITLK